jgi:hypothetical protein
MNQAQLSAEIGKHDDRPIPADLAAIAPENFLAIA